MHVFKPIFRTRFARWMVYISMRLCLKLLNFFVQASLSEISVYAKFQIEIRKHDFSKTWGPLQGSIGNRYIEHFLAETNLSRYPICFSALPGCYVLSIYKNKIEIAWAAGKISSSNNKSYEKCTYFSLNLS